jgi:hypothetical protein
MAFDRLLFGGNRRATRVCGRTSAKPVLDEVFAQAVSARSSQSCVFEVT